MGDSDGDRHRVRAGVIAPFGSRLPDGIRVFMLALAVVDDIGSYPSLPSSTPRTSISSPLGVAVGLVGVVVFLRLLSVTQLSVFVVVGVGMWLATYASGEHATIAGVVLGLLTPATAIAGGELAREWSQDLEDEPSPEDVRAMTLLARSLVSVAERLQYRIHPFTSFVVVPLFVLANAGVRINSDVLGNSAYVVRRRPRCHRRTHHRERRWESRCLRGLASTFGSGRCPSG